MTDEADELARRALALPDEARLALANELLASLGATAAGLRPADLRMRAMYEHSPIAIGFSRDGVTIDANLEYARTFGYASPDELIGTPILDAIAPRERGTIIDNVARRARGEPVPDIYETVGLRKDGSEFPFEIHATRVVLDDGPLTMASLHDITERKRAEAATREAAEFQRRLIAASPSVILAYEAEEAGRCVLANEAAAAMVGATTERLLAQRFREIESWRRSGLLDLAEAALRTGALQRREVELRTTFGRDVVMSAAIVPFDSGGKRHLLLLANDVTERRRVEAALRRSEERLTLVLEATDQGIWDWDLVTGERHVSPGFYRLLGLEPGPGALDAERLLGLLDPEDAASARQALADDRGDVRELEVRLPLPGGAWRWLLVRGRVLLRGDDGAARRVVGTIADVTERKRAEEDQRRFDERVRHAAKLESLGVLAGGIAHDFNNLLAAIIANADLALLELAPGAPGRESIEAVVGASWRAAELCRQMLAYAGKGRLAAAAVDLRELVPEMLQLLQASISKKATLSWAPPAWLPAVTVDPSQLRQVVMNLVLNASEALEGERGTIVVTTGSVDCDEAALRRTVLAEGCAPGTYVFLEVTDSGCGMDAATQARMFEPFFTTKFKGRGLGMAAVLGIVRGHEGTIEVESHVGRGTRLRVLLPASPATAAPQASEPAVAPERWGNGVLLIADDEREVRRVVAAMLSRMGFEPLEARDGAEALALFRRHGDRIVGVLLDLTMPVMDGLEALDELRRLAPTTPVVLSSGYGEEQAERRLAAHAGVVFVAKPYTHAGLADALRRALGLGGAPTA